MLTSGPGAVPRLSHGLAFRGTCQLYVVLRQSCHLRAWQPMLFTIFRIDVPAKPGLRLWQHLPAIGMLLHCPGQQQLHQQALQSSGAF